MTRLLLAVLTLLAMSSPLRAEPSHQEKVIGCLLAMRSDADWAVCRNLMFANCPTQEVGSPEHVACLEGEVAEWEAYLERAHAELVDALASDGAVELTTLIGQWRGYMANRCAEVAAARPEAGKAAGLGCRISETAGLATELAACKAGFSNEPYCRLKEK